MLSVNLRLIYKTIDEEEFHRTKSTLTVPKCQNINQQLKIFNFDRFAELPNFEQKNSGLRLC